MMKETLETALRLIEEISSNAQSTNPKADWRDSHDSILEIFRLAHAVNSPECLKNHPEWIHPVWERMYKNCCVGLRAAVQEKKDECAR